MKKIFILLPVLAILSACSTSKKGEGVAPTEIYLVRHAQSYPVDKVAMPNWPLTAKGKKQAEALAPLLQTLNVQRALTSPMLRCVETMNAFTALTKMKAEPVADLRERLAFIEMPEDFGKLWDDSWKDFNYALPSCESSAAAQKRIVQAIYEIAKKYPGEKIVACTHGNTIGLLLNNVDSKFHKAETEKLRNPDVIKIVVGTSAVGTPLIEWQRDYKLPGLDQIAR